MGRVLIVCEGQTEKNYFEEANGIHVLNPYVTVDKLMPYLLNA